MSNLDKLIFDEIQKTDGTTISLDTLQEKYFKSIYQNSYEFTQDVYNYIGKIQYHNDTDKNYVYIYIKALLSDDKYGKILIIRDYYFQNECFRKQTEIINQIKEYKKMCKQKTESIQTFINPPKEL